MATGKTTIGKELAHRLNKEFHEMDSLIEEMAGKSVPAIFKEDGEIRFREYEMAVCKEIASKKNSVISCGGGVIMNKLNIDYLKLSSEIILLEASPKVIYMRAMAEGKEKRPKIDTEDPMDEITRLFEFRKPFYVAASEKRVNTDHKTTDQIIDEILTLIQLD